MVRLARTNPLNATQNFAGIGDVNRVEEEPVVSLRAAVLGVNTNTVLRPLRVLCDEGLLELRRGRRVWVREAGA
jgi:DNA-binding transcriptional regulator YhcF (GntR family)